ncbi:hypothetical protein POMI540_4717 [Schizosaccharomyces pombe]
MSKEDEEVLESYFWTLQESIPLRRRIREIRELQERNKNKYEQLLQERKDLDRFRSTLNVQQEQLQNEILGFKQDVKLLNNALVSYSSEELEKRFEESLLKEKATSMEMESKLCSKSITPLEYVSWLLNSIE